MQKKQDATFLIRTLQSDGHRITKARSALLELFASHHSPLSALELQHLLAQQKIVVNKTTIYRELDFLIQHNIIHTVAFGDDTARYELQSRDHHHHIQCTSCGDVVDLPLQNELAEIERHIVKSTHFVIEKHALEFFGVCPKCQ